MPSKGRGMSTGYRLGDHNALCDRCQRKFFGSQLRKEWTGFLVCESCYDPRHPQEYLSGHPDKQSVEDARPDIATTCGPGSVPNQAVPNCAIPNHSEGYTNPL